MSRVKWLLDFAIDYGAVLAVGFFAAIFLWGSLIEPLYNPPRARDGLGIATILGVLFMTLALKVWRDVRAERRR